MTKVKRTEAIEELRRQADEILGYIEDLKICTKKDLAGQIETIDMSLSALVGDLSDFKAEVV